MREREIAQYVQFRFRPFMCVRAVMFASSADQDPDGPAGDGLVLSSADVHEHVMTCIVQGFGNKPRQYCLNDIHKTR